MRTLFHSLVYLALGVWLGALVFFGAVLAPIVFTQLPPLFPIPAARFSSTSIEHRCMSRDWSCCAELVR
jgi:hypothetical protein